MMEDVHVKLNPGLPWQELHSARKRLFLATFGAWLCMVLKLGHFGQQIRNTWKVVKCGAGEGWRRSAGPIM